MKSWAKHPLRVTGRLLWLGGELLFAAINYVRQCAFQSGDSMLLARARWLQRSSRRMLNIFQVEMHVAGSTPPSGLLVRNHLGYLDILVLAVITPSLFVAKSEVRHWPVLGWFARIAGTIFVDRSKPSQAARSADEIAAALRHGALVVLFPEGTSSGGDTVLPFKSSLFEPATKHVYSVTAGLIGYELSDGDVSEEVCYWKDMTLLPHLINLLSKRTIRASVSFTQFRQGSTNRKELARQLHSEVMRLKEAFAPKPTMKVIVTCGPSYEPIDEVRRITNFSTGELGIQLCDALIHAGFEVFCFKGSGATHPGPSGRCHLSLFDTNEDLLELLIEANSDHNVAAVFHVAALCDYKVKRVQDDRGRNCRSAKIASRSGELTINLEPATKIIGKMRDSFPRSILVGGKYELLGARSDALAKAARQIEENRTDACVLNGRAFGPGFAFCHHDNSLREFGDKGGLVQFLAAWLDEVLCASAVGATLRCGFDFEPGRQGGGGEEVSSQRALS